MSKHKFWTFFGFKGKIVRQFWPDLTIQCEGVSHVSLIAAVVRFRCVLVSFFVFMTWEKRRETPCVITTLLLVPENTAAFSHCFLSWLFNQCT